MANRYRVALTEEERNLLTSISSNGKSAVRKIIMSRALLLLDRGEYADKKHWTVQNKIATIISEGLVNMVY